VRPEVQTTGFGCVRFLGSEEVYTSPYSGAAAPLGGKITTWHGWGNRDIYVYFDNDAKVAVPRNALKPAEILGVRRDPPDHWD